MFKLDRGLPVLLTLLTVAACRGEDGTSGTETASSTGNAEESASTTDEPTPTTSGTTDGSTSTGDDETATTEVVAPTDTGDNSVGFITTMTGTESDTNTGPLPNGSECGSDDDCASMNCFSILAGMASFCADCNEDQDCVDAGTGTACSLDVAGQNATCTSGEAGSTCMSDEACADGLQCEAVIEVPLPGLIPDTCSDCAETADCMNAQLCSPQFDLENFSGQKACVEPGSVENNQLCPEGPDGDMVCMSGHCGSATIMGLIEVFICGECTEDGDCDPGQVCMPAEASQNGFSGATCV